MMRFWALRFGFRSLVRWISHSNRWSTATTAMEAVKFCN
jgi:hypothetical protein